MHIEHAVVANVSATTVTFENLVAVPAGVGGAAARLGPGFESVSERMYTVILKNAPATPAEAIMMVVPLGVVSVVPGVTDQLLLGNNNIRTTQLSLTTGVA